MSARDGIEPRLDSRPEGTGTSDEVALAMLEPRTSKAIIRHRGWLVRRMLVLADIVGLVAAFVVTDLILGGGALRQSVVSKEFVVIIAALAGWVVVAKMAGLYDRDEERTDYSTVDDLAGVVLILTMGVWIGQLAALVTDSETPSLTRLATLWAFSGVFVVTGRIAARAVCRRTAMYGQNAVIVGSGEVGQLFAHKIQQHPEYRINLLGFIGAASQEPRADLDPVPVLGPLEQLPALVRLLEVERIVIAFPEEKPPDIVWLIRSLSDLDVQIDIVPRLFEVVGPNATIHSLEGLPLIGLPAFSLSRSSQWLKRGMDIVLAGAGLVVLFPLFVLIALAIKIDSRGPVFFRQVRMGAHERTFRIHKFRTMVNEAEERKHELAHLNMYVGINAPRMFMVRDDPRCTRFGRFLRRYSLDELPQLIDVLRGKMSLVGPRPLILDEDQHVVEWARKRLNMRPGITGLWQVLGRNDIPFDDMTKLDYAYVTNWSPWGDVVLILRTIPTLFRSRRAY